MISLIYIKFFLLFFIKSYYLVEQVFGVNANVSLPPGSLSSSSGNVDEALSEKEEKIEFNVVLKEVPSDKRITIIKVVRSLTSLGLKEAKDLIDNVPKFIFESVSKERAEEVKKLLEEAGAVVELN